MKALSIKQPWAEEIRLGLKRIEYRSWRTDYRGPVLICSSKNDERIRGMSADKRRSMPLGMAVAVVEIVDCIEADDGYGFVLDRVRSIVPFPVRGNLRFFDVEYCEEG